jgi:lysophospholipase L1-like esterase
VILGAALLAAAFLALNLRNLAFYQGSVRDLVLHVGLPGGLMLLLIGALWLPASWRGALALSMVSLVPALYLAEYVFSAQGDEQIAHYAQTHGTGYDGRTKLEILTDLRQGGTEAFPSVRGKDLLVDDGTGKLISPIQIDGRPFLPLAGVPNRTTVACNETGTWLTYQADQNGFRNPPEAWSKPLDVALIGDSYTHGYCVADAAGLAGQLRRTHRVLNLGISGIGPLSQLAILKEYAPALEPRNVIWLFYEGNDIPKDLPQESKSDLLMAYLAPGFSQNLIERADDVTRTLIPYLDDHMQDALSRIDNPYQDMIEHVTLHQLRDRLGIDPISLGFVHKNTDAMLTLFDQIIGEAKRTVGAWDGKLSVVYIPDQARFYAGGGQDPVRDHIREKVRDAVVGHGLAFIDLDPVVERPENGTSLWYSPWSHFNEKGYRVLAQEVERDLGGAIADGPTASHVGASIGQPPSGPN